MTTFRDVIRDRDVREVHYQPRRQWLPMTAEHGAFQGDLCFFDEYTKQNRGYNGLLCVINMASRYGYAVPIKGKNDTFRAFELFVREARKNGQEITRLETDNGTEFLNRQMSAFLKEGIEHTTAAPEDHRKQGMVERFNGTIRHWIERWLTEKNTNNWIDVMPEIIDYYNTKKHSTTHKAPADMTVGDENELRSRLYDKSEKQREAVNDIQPGDRVRVLLNKKAFGKGRLRWSDNVYTIEARVEPSNSFTLKETDGSYKYSDLQLVRESSRNIGQKSAETVALSEKRSHALRLGRSHLTRGVAESEAMIDAVASMPAERQRRERRAPAWHADYDMVPPAPSPPPPQVSEPQVAPPPPPRRSSRATRAPSRLDL